MKLATVLLIFGALVVGFVIGTAIQPLRAQQQAAYKIVPVPLRITSEPWLCREEILNDWAKQGYELVWTQVAPTSSYPDVFILRKR